MLRRARAVALAALFVLGCGKVGLDDGQTLVAYKAAGTQKAPESAEGKLLVEKMAETEKAALRVVQQEPVPTLATATLFYADNEAFEEAGYYPSTLTLTLERDQTAGRAYVALKTYEGIPEEAEIFDDMGQAVGLVTYLWERDGSKVDSPPHVLGAVKKSPDQRMLGLHYYCTKGNQLYVHDLNSFRVHAAFARKVSVAKGDINIEYIAPKDVRRPAWPTCADLADWHDGPTVQPFQTAYGIHRLHYSFDDSGNPVLVEYLDRLGKPAENLRGIHKRQMFWEDGRMSGQAWYSAAGLLSRYNYEYDSKGNILRRRVMDAQGQPGLDFFGVYTYDYERDSRERVTRQTRRDKNNDVVEIHEFTYAIYNQLETHVIKDGQGNIRTSLVHEYNKQGARVSLKSFEGDQSSGVLRLDENLVAIYNWEYSDRGRPIAESRHNGNLRAGDDGKEHHQLTNARDTWAIIKYDYDEAGQVIRQVQIRVDGQGNPIYESAVDMRDRPVYRIARTFNEAGAMVSAVKTLFEEGIKTKEQILDGTEAVILVAKLGMDDDGNEVSRAWFAADEQTTADGPEGWHKKLTTLGDEGEPTEERYLGLQENLLETKAYVYSDGLPVRETWTKAGQDKPYKAITRQFDTEGNLKDTKKEGF
jgi:hypothetical protein